MAATDPSADRPAGDAPRRPVLRRVARGLLWACAILIVLGVAGGGLALTLPGRSFDAPAWVEERVERRLQELMPGQGVQVERMRVAFESDLRPRIGMQDVELTDASGLTRLTLGDIDLGLSLAAVSQGRVQARELTVTGVVIAVARARDGTFDLSFGREGAARARFDDLGAALATAATALDDPRLAELSEIRLDGLTLRYDDARAGRNWTVDGGGLRVARREDAVTLEGSFAVLGGGSSFASLAAAAEMRPADGAVSFALDVADFAAADLATQSPALAWLDVLRAPISGRLEGGIGPGGTLLPLKAALTLGEGAVQPTAATEPIPFRGATTQITYTPGDGRIAFDTLALDSPWLSIRGGGQVLLGALQNGLPQEYTGQFRFDRVAGTLRDLYASEQSFGAADLDLKLSLRPFELKLGRAVLRDGDMMLRARGRAAVGQEGWIYGVEAFADTLDAARALALWPTRMNPNTRAWVADNITAATLRNVQFALSHAGKGPPRDLYLGFAFADAEVRPLPDLPPITGGEGQFALYRDRLAVEVRDGAATAPQGGTVRFAGSRVVIPDVRQKPSRIEVALSGAGPVPAVLSLIDEKPFEFLSKAGQPVTLVSEGTVRFAGTVATELSRPGEGEPRPEVDYAFAGTATGVVSDTLVKGRRLAAERLDIAVDPAGGIRIAGTGDLSGVSFDGGWSQGIGPQAGPGQVRATVEISPAALDAFGITLPPGTVSGRGRGTLDLTLGKGAAPAFAIASDLAGIGLRLDALGWSKAPGATGSLQVAGRLGAAPSVERIALSAPGLSAAGTLDLGEGGRFRVARLERVQAGDWLDAAVTLTARGPGAAPAIAVSGGRVDLRSAPFGQGGGGGGGGGSGAGGTTPLSLALGRLVVSDGIEMAPFQGDFTVGQGLSGAFRGRINGDAPVEGRVAPSRGSTGFEIVSADAGRALSAAKLLKRAAGGALTLRMRPVADRPGHYDGQLAITDTRLKDAPAIASLLSAISVVGLIEQMGGEGIYFSEVEADFRLAPDRVTLLKSSAIGPSMGISAEGVYRFRDGEMDLRGVVSPLYLINGIGAIFTRNREGLFGFTYWIKGQAAEPRVGVNPMSIFTPAMFRDLFRRPPPKVK